MSPSDPMTLFTDTVTLGKKGQLTLPKRLRDHDGFKEDDEFILTRLPGGEMTLKKKTTKNPEDKLLAILDRFPKFDVDTVWSEIRAERKAEDAARQRRNP